MTERKYVLRHTDSKGGGKVLCLLCCIKESLLNCWRNACIWSLCFFHHLRPCVTGAYIFRPGEMLMKCPLGPINDCCRHEPLVIDVVVDVSLACLCYRVIYVFLYQAK